MNSNKDEQGIHDSGIKADKQTAIKTRKRKSWWKKLFDPPVKSKPCYTFNEYMENRVRYKIKIYDKKARWHRRWYYSIALVTAIAAATVPVLVNLKDQEIFGINKNIIVTALSLLVTIGVSVQEIYRFREHWRNFDLIYANLRREQLLFSGVAGVYAEKETLRERENLFIKNIEELIKDERWDTINLQTSSRAPDKN